MKFNAFSSIIGFESDSFNINRAMSRTVRALIEEKTEYSYKVNDKTFTFWYDGRFMIEIASVNAPQYGKMRELNREEWKKSLRHVLYVNYHDILTRYYK